MLNGLQMNRWIRALTLAKLLFEDEGYFTTYLNEIEHFIKEKGDGSNKYLWVEGKEVNNHGKHKRRFSPDSLPQVARTYSPVLPARQSRLCDS